MTHVYKDSVSSPHHQHKLTATSTTVAWGTGVAIYSLSDSSWHRRQW